MCNWKIVNTNDYMRDSPLGSSIKLPTRDHTLSATDGHYLRVNPIQQPVILSYTVPPGLPANHTLPVIAPKPMCLKLWYYFGEMPPNILTSSDYFNVSTSRALNLNGEVGRTIKLFKKQDQWLYTRINMNLRVNDKVMIKTQRSSQYTVIPFDDIQIQKQACEPPGWCDFENGISFIKILKISINIHNHAFLI